MQVVREMWLYTSGTNRESYAQGRSGGEGGAVDALASGVASISAAGDRGETFAF